jgi:hypothetical protein
MIILFAGEFETVEMDSNVTDSTRGGTTGCVVAGRLAEDPNVRILVIEAGQHNKDLENVHMTGGYVTNSLACVILTVADGRSYSTRRRTGTSSRRR